MINKNVEVEYIPNKSIIYNDTEFTNIVNLEDKKYTRENNEYIITFDLKNMIMECFLKDKNMKFSSEINGSITSNKENIYILYTLNDEDKEIIIQLL